MQLKLKGPGVRDVGVIGDVVMIGEVEYLGIAREKNSRVNIEASKCS